jgi:uncharacterized protein (DUF433 family)
MPLSIEAEPVPLATDSDGVVRVGGTRVTLDTVVVAFLDGASAEGIVESFPTLRLADVYAVLGYYLRHQAEVDGYLSQRRAEADELQKEMEKRFDPIGVRARLLARQKRQGN